MTPAEFRESQAASLAICEAAANPKRDRAEIAAEVVCVVVAIYFAVAHIGPAIARMILP